MNVQDALDDYMRTHPFSSVVDMEFIRSDSAVNIRRKIGHRPVVIRNISETDTEEKLISRLLAHPAVY